MAASTLVLTHTRISPPFPGTPAATRPFLVATDGTHESDDAIIVAHALASAASSELHAISVCEDLLPPSQLPVMFSPVYTAGDPSYTRANRRMRVGDQMLRVLGPGHGATIVVRSGNVGTSIASYAAERGCEMVVAGRGRHGVVERLLGEEHMLRLLRATERPVLMVEAGLRAAPRRVVIGLDFSERDIGAAEIARQVMAADAKVFLAHVHPDLPYSVSADRSWLPSYGDAMRRGIERIRGQLAFEQSHRVETVLLTGHPGKSLASFAERAEADLVAVGVHGLGFMHRLVIGSTAAYLLRAAPCSLLAAPVPRMRG